MVSSACVSGELYAFEPMSNMQHGAKCTVIASTWFGTTVYTDVHVKQGQITKYWIGHVSRTGYKLLRWA